MAKFFSIIVVSVLRMTGYAYFKQFTRKKYFEVYQKGVNKGLLWTQIEGTFLISLMSVFVFIPQFLIDGFKRIIAFFLFYFLSSYKKIIHNNLKIAFQEKYTDKERKKMVRASFTHSLDSLIWLLEIVRLNKEKVLNSAKVTGYEHVENALKKNKGLILCAPHYSRFLFPAFYVGLGQENKLHFIIRRIDNPLVGETAYMILNNLGLNVIIRNHWALKKSIYALKKNEIVFLLMDQNVAIGGMFVPFFSVPASTFKGVHYLQQKTDCEIICCHSRYHDGQYEVNYSPSIDLHGIKEESELIIKINKYYEEAISKHPECHLWMHPRWKRRPDGEPSLYPDVPNLAKL